MSLSPLDVLDVLVPERDGTTWENLPDLWRAYAEERSAGRPPLESAVRVAVRADRLGHAFAVGYPAALEHLVPGVTLPCALCVTEAGGNRPRAIATTLKASGNGYRLDGTKTFVTFGTLAQSLIVAAKAGETPDGRPELAVVRIPATRDGVTLEELSPTPFVPEVAHARVTLTAVEVKTAERLPGDGYLEYVKPFRTIEDLHVVAATLGYVFGWVRRAGGPHGLLAELSAHLVTLAALREGAPLDPRIHVALHGCYERVVQTLRGSELMRALDGSSAAERERWERDKKLLSIASSAREARFASARKALF